MGIDTDKLLQSRWLSGSDVEPFVNATVHSITEEEVGRDKEVKVIVWFEEFDKGLVCNRTNLKNLINLLGKGNTDDWKGKQVQLYATTQEFGGEEYNVVRVRAVQPAGKVASGKSAPGASPQVAFAARVKQLYGDAEPSAIKAEITAAGRAAGIDGFDGNWRDLGVENLARLQEKMVERHKAMNTSSSGSPVDDIPF